MVRLAVQIQMGTRDAVGFTENDVRHTGLGFNWPHWLLRFLRSTEDRSMANKDLPPSMLFKLYENQLAIVEAVEELSY